MFLCALYSFLILTLRSDDNVLRGSCYEYLSTNRHDWQAAEIPPPAPITAFASKLAVCPITSTPPLTGLKPAYDENCQGIKLSFGHKIEHLLLLLTCCGECSDQRISAALFYALRAILGDSEFLYFNYKGCSSLIILNVGVPMTKKGKNSPFGSQIGYNTLDATRRSIIFCWYNWQKTAVF